MSYVVVAGGGVAAGLLLVVFGTPAYVVAAALLVLAIVRASRMLSVLLAAAGGTSLALIGWAMVTCVPSDTNACSAGVGLTILIVGSAALLLAGAFIAGPWRRTAAPQ